MDWTWDVWVSGIIDFLLNHYNIFLAQTFFCLFVFKSVWYWMILLWFFGGVCAQRFCIIRWFNSRACKEFRWRGLSLSTVESWVAPWTVTAVVRAEIMLWNQGCLPCLHRSVCNILVFDLAGIIFGVKCMLPILFFAFFFPTYVADFFVQQKFHSDF